MNEAKNENKPDLTKFGGHTIDTKVERVKKAVVGIASCPICGKTEESDDDGFGANHAVVVSLGKVRAHMTMAHGTSDPKQ